VLSLTLTNTTPLGGAPGLPGSDAGVLEALSEITAPTLVIGATADPLFPPPQSETLAALIRGARLATVDGMGHGFPSPGLPERLANLVLAHCGRPLTHSEGCADCFGRGAARSAHPAPRERRPGPTTAAGQ
jgi:acetyl esterase/lipase